MLQRIRDGASGPLAYVVVAVITVVFGVWGIGSYFTPSSDPVVASAGDTKITHSQLQRAFDQRYQRLRQMMGDQFKSDMFPPDKIRRSVLDGLINQAILTQYARRAGYRVTDADLLAQIRGNPQFQRNGQFSAQRYKALLGQAGIAPAQYEARLRQGMISGQVRRVIAGTAFAAPPEVSVVYKQAHEQRRVSVLSFDPAAFIDRVKLNPGEIKTYYDQHPNQFMRAPRVKLAYVALNAGQLSPGSPDQATLRKLYKAHRKEFGAPAKRSAAMVRIPIQDGDNAKARDAVQKAFKAAQNGQSLKAIAERTQGAAFKHIDSQTKSALGDAVGPALFKLQSGTLSNPVRGDDAWYILRLTHVEPAQTPKFDDPAVQARLKAMARRKADAEAFKSKSDQLDDLAYQAPNDLKTISNKLDLKIRHSGWITPSGGEDLGDFKAVREAAFSDAVLKDKLNSEVLKLGGQRRVVLRVVDQQPAKRKPLSAVRQSIHDRLVHNKAAQLARQSAHRAMVQAQKGKSLSALASGRKGITLRQPGYVSRESSNLDPQIVSAAFNLPATNPGQDTSQPAEYKVVTSGNNQVALVAMTGTRIGNSNSQNQDAGERDQLAQQQRGYNASLEYQALARYLREQADVEIHKDALR